MTISYKIVQKLMGAGYSFKGEGLYYTPDGRTTPHRAGPSICSEPDERGVSICTADIRTYDPVPSEKEIEEMLYQLADLHA